jgi:hypothetical protein
LSDGSWNLIVGADGLTRPFKGLATQGANTGSRKMVPFGDTWGGIKDNGLVQGSGNFFQDIGRSRWAIGAGTPHIEGTSVSGFTLSTNLQLQTMVAGVPKRLLPQAWHSQARHRSALSIRPGSYQTQ